MVLINIILLLSVMLPIYRVRPEFLLLLKNSFSRIFFRHQKLYDLRHEESDQFQADLPIIRFQDLQDRRHREVEETCFACDVNYEGDDVVTQLGRCGHVYHSECVGKMIQRKQTDCPFCRSSFFSGRPSIPCKNFR